MPGRRGEITGQDLFGLANVVRGINRDKQTNANIARRNEQDKMIALQRKEADTGYQAGFGGGELPAGSSAYTQRGYTSGGQQQSKIVISQKPQDVEAIQSKVPRLGILGVNCLLVHLQM